MGRAKGPGGVSSSPPGSQQVWRPRDIHKSLHFTLELSFIQVQKTPTINTFPQPGLSVHMQLNYAWFFFFNDIALCKRVTT